MSMNPVEEQIRIFSKQLKIPTFANYGKTKSLIYLCLNLGAADLLKTRKTL